MNYQLSEGESRQLVFDSYVLHAHAQTCLGCGSTERYTQIYEVWVHPTKSIQNLRPVAGTINSAKPIYQVAVKPRAIPVCVACATISVYQSAPDNVIPVSREAWAETLRRKYAPQAAETKVAKATPTKVVPTLDEI